ncbi:isocitrate dehydrogenase, partial [Favolaschia claudopus]
RLATPYVYRNALLKFESNARSLALQLQREPDLGRHIRTLAFCFPGNTMPVEFSKIVMYTFRLTELHADTCRPISWDSFTCLGETAGETLRVFRGIEICDIQGVDPGPFCLFSQIREFQWKSSREFITDSSLIPKAAFGLLENLTVDTFYESFLDVLAHMELPHLRTVTFDSDSATGGALFFQKHGAKIQELTVSEFQMTDNRLGSGDLEQLSVSKDSENSRLLWNTSACALFFGVCHASLICSSCSILLLCRCLGSIRAIFTLIQHQPTHINDLIEELRTTMLFPNLREVEHPLCKWPKNEYQIATSSWARQAEHLLKHHIRLHGPDGVTWRPRLQLAGPGDRYGQDLEQVRCHCTARTIQDVHAEVMYYRMGL